MNSDKDKLVESVKQAFEATIAQNSAALTRDQIRCIITLTEDVEFAKAVYHELKNLELDKKC